MLSVSICFRRSGGSEGGWKINSWVFRVSSNSWDSTEALRFGLENTPANTNASLVWGGAQIKDCLSHEL